MILFSKETTADHHQVPRMRIKRVRGTIKTETGTGRDKWTHVCTGYRNITGAPQAFAIWGTMFARRRNDKDNNTACNNDDRGANEKHENTHQITIEYNR